MGKQFHQVARLMSTRQQRKAERDFFFVQLGGFDTHSDVVETLNTKFQEVDQALSGFVNELKAQGVFNNTVIFTESDFGRTLSFNGRGTDHGWGGNHIIIGGAIQGGNIFNKYLDDFSEGGPSDAGRGRVIPTYPWESVLVPVAEWMGVSDASTVFPNLKNFNRSFHIIPREKLFNN